MILQWWKNKQAKKKIIEEKHIHEWKENYFQDVVFPIIIFETDGYLGVSDIEEYYIDVDINIHFVTDSCTLVDSRGNKFNFKKIDNNAWVPNKKIGEENFQSVRERIMLLIYMPEHKAGIDKTQNIKELIELIVE